MNPPTRESAAWGWAVLAVAVVIAAVSAHPYAGGWNDGSRLATVESLVDRHTWVIDDSIFVNPSAETADHPHRQAPYAAPDPAADYLLKHEGTLDKLFINGHYYSDKSPVPSLWLAAVYAAFRFCTGWTAATHAGAFCYLLTLASSGLAYVVAVWSVWRLGRPLGLAPRLRLLLTASFGLATVALPYVRHVNNHILLLGVVAALMTEMAQLAARGRGDVGPDAAAGPAGGAELHHRRRHGAAAAGRGGGVAARIAAGGRRRWPCSRWRRRRGCCCTTA